MSRRKNESYQRRREQHLNNGNVTLIATEDFGERIGVIYSEAFRCTCDLDVSLSLPIAT